MVASPKPSYEACFIKEYKTCLFWLVILVIKLLGATIVTHATCMYNVFERCFLNDAWYKTIWNQRLVFIPVLTILFLAKLVVALGSMNEKE